LAAQREEEEEAERLQRRRLKSLTAADYGLDEQLASPPAPTTKKTKSKTAARTDPLEALASGRGEAAPAVERVARDLSRLSSEEARALVAEDAPELLGLLADLQTRMQELETHLGPLLARVAKGELRASQGLSLLHVKHRACRGPCVGGYKYVSCPPDGSLSEGWPPSRPHPELLLSYCTNLCFYFYLKASGERVADHPVIAALVEQRALLEKLRPMEVRLKYQIDRLVQAATTGVAAGGPSLARVLGHRPALTRRFQQRPPSPTLAGWLRCTARARARTTTMSAAGRPRTLSVRSRNGRAPFLLPTLATC
jgi:U3 small nucleolar RNA-associated protein 3